MALPLSPQQPKQSISLSMPLALQSYSTPRQLTPSEVGHEKLDDETLSMNQREAQLLSSGPGHVTYDVDMSKFSPPNPVVPDLPLWTPLRTPEGDEGSCSDPEADELSINKATDSSMWRLGKLPANAQATSKNVTAGQTPNTSSDAKSLKTPKKARFDGVFIAAKPPPNHKKHSSQAQSRPSSTSNALVLSLVDALARTFDANRHSEDLAPRRSRSALRQQHDASTAPQTDAETTEAEDEQLQLNTRLARTTLNRPRHARARAVNASETNSEDATPLLRDVPPLERPVKRLKPIQYESNAALIDAALGTVQASIGWDAELDFIVKDDNVVSPTQVGYVPSGDVRMNVIAGDHTAGPLENGSTVPPSTPLGDEWRMPTCIASQKPEFATYLSRGAKFRQRLGALFGENVTVRTDKTARPRPADLDIFASPDELDREPSPPVSKSTVSASPASITEGASAIPSTRVTSQSPDTPPVDTSMGQLPGNQISEIDSLTRPTFDAREEQVNGWITALQRLVKGKVHIKEEDLETLSIILAEIESVKDGLGANIPVILELRETVKQLSELYEIPFGDRNKLRQRAVNIIRTWSSMGTQELLGIHAN